MKTSFVAGLICLFALAPTAWAVSHDIEGNSWGTFSNPQGLYSVDIDNGNPTSRVSWGGRSWGGCCCCCGDDDSTLTFYGQSDICKNFVADGACFLLGKLKFCNNLNKDDLGCMNCGSVDLTVNLQLDNPAAPNNPYQIEFDLGILELWLIFPDKVKIELDEDAQTNYEFCVGDYNYFLTFGGFVDACGHSKECLLACENDCDYAWLKACLRREEKPAPPQEEPIPEPATLLLLGTGIVPLILRLRKIRKN